MEYKMSEVTKVLAIRTRLTLIFVACFTVIGIVLTIIYQHNLSSTADRITIPMLIIGFIAGFIFALLVLRARPWLGGGLGILAGGLVGWASRYLLIPFILLGLGYLVGRFVGTLAMKSQANVLGMELVVSFLNDENNHILRNEGDYLGDTQKEEAVGILIEALKDKRVEIRRRAATALTKIGNQRAVEPLIQALNDNDWSVRSNAVDAIGRIGGSTAIEPLSKALTDRHPSVRSVAERAIRKINEKA